MKVYNQNKTQVLQAYDLTQGKIVADKLLVAHHDATPAIEGKTAEEVAQELEASGQKIYRKGDKVFLVLKEYPNGGQDVKTIKPVEAIPAKDAWDEYEDIYVYTPYTETELAAIAANKAISEAKAYLSRTDYIVLKIAEATAEGDAAGVAALQEEYAVQLARRKEARAMVNEKEAAVMAMEA